MAQLKTDAAPSPQDVLPSEYEDLPTTRWGLDFADVLQIREKLKLTPTERLQAAQETLNAAIRIRAQNGRNGRRS